MATLVSLSMVPSFWCSLEDTAAELYLCFVIKSDLWWKCTFLQRVTVFVLRHKHMKLLRPFAPHVIAWSVIKGFNQSIRRMKEQETRQQCLARAMSKPVKPSGAMKSVNLLRRKTARIWQCSQKRRE